MLTQSEATYQLLAQEYKAQQARLKQIKEKINNQSQCLDDKIQRQLQKLKLTSQMIIKSAANRTQMYVESLQQDHLSSNIVNLSILSSYLKQQKSHLSSLISSSQTNGASSQKHKSGKQLLHSLSKRKKVQRYYQHLQCVRLEKQIQYLQKNILLGKPTNSNKQSIAYDNIDSVTLKQQQELKQKMKMLLDQLQRVVGLSIQCGGDQDERLDRRIVSLKQQAQRLSEVEQIVDRETKQIVMVKDFFNSQNQTEVIGFLQEKICEIQNNSIKKLSVSKPLQISSKSISQEQIDFLLNLSCQAFESVKVYKKPFDQVNDLLASCKAKLKKVKI